ncbi:MAG: DUF1206 domain-containing protein [Chloroflexota bacterium]
MAAGASVNRTARSAEGGARSTANSPGFRLLERCGIATRGIVYILIGILTAQAAFGRGGAVADQAQALKTIYGEPHGRVLLAIITIGLFGYALYCFVKAFLDTEGHGTDAKGAAARVGYAVAGISYGALAWGAFQFIRGTAASLKGSNASTQQHTAQALNLPFGRELVVIIGLIVLIVAASQCYRAYTANFQKHLALERLRAEAKRWVIYLGRFGYAARGVIFAIIGLFLVVAGLHRSAAAAKGVSGALQEVLAQPYGHLLAGVVALGFVAFGAYSLAEARYRKLGRA